jgi:hypothetical protein
VRSPILFAIFTTAAIAANPPAPTGLLTNSIENPQAIDVAPPALSWVMNELGWIHLLRKLKIVVMECMSKCFGNIVIGCQPHRNRLVCKVSRPFQV